MKKRLGWILFTLVAINLVAFMHAWQFTHFTANGTRTNPELLTFTDKVIILFTGIKNPRPSHKGHPSLPFEKIFIQSDVKLEAWYIKTDTARGTIILFHGYSGEKSALISRAEVFTKLGYHTLLVDFKGSGGSEGNSTTVGFSEGREVIDCYNFIRQKGEVNIILFGTSMGAAAVLKAVAGQTITPTSIILECPFGQLDKTVAARFRMMGVPAFPMSDVLTFWGGVQNGYWAFDHNPEEYAKNVRCPTLLMFGEKDDRVSREETNQIYKNLPGEKKLLVTYPDQGHALFTLENQSKWIHDVSSFVGDLSEE